MTTIRARKANIKTRFLALGDSYTICTGVEPSLSWPKQLTGALWEEGIAIEEACIVAQNGWTTRDLLNAIEAADSEGPYDLVTLLIGVNNQYQGEEVAVYGSEFGALLGMAVNCAGGSPSKVLVLSIPDWSVTPFAEGRERAKIRREIEQFNRINKYESQRAGVHYLDMNPISRLAADDLSLLASDELHFSGRMYAVWVDLLRPVVIRILEMAG